MALQRVSIPELDSILGVKYPVGPDGFVRVIDYMGGDASIVQAARVSYGAGTKKVSEDRGLIRYLMRHYHTTPFEMAEIKFHVRVPMDAWRQWIRHRTASVNEYSTRYSIAIDAKQTTAPDEWRLQSTSNKQGSGGFLDVSKGEVLSAAEASLHATLQTEYERRIEWGVAREQARKDLPLSTYTEAYWKIDLHNLLHFLRLRMDSHAQKEIRDFAYVLSNIVHLWVPDTWEAFEDYRLGSVVLTRLEKELITDINNSRYDLAQEKMDEWGWLRTTDEGVLKRNRERQECEEKFKDLGINLSVLYI